MDICAIACLQLEEEEGHEVDLEPRCNFVSRRFNNFVTPCSPARYETQQELDTCVFHEISRTRHALCEKKTPGVFLQGAGARSLAV